MAKRKRLMPARANFLENAAEAGRARTGLTAPIAQVAGEAAATAAFSEVAGALQAARSEGRMIEALPLDAIDPAYLVRDRLVQDEEEMAALMDSLRARGQQMPVEVIVLPEPSRGHSHGLISGWRRLTALRRLYKKESDPKFATIRALVIRPDTAQDAYISMVEENEIRVDLSHYERARIVVRAMQEGVYPTRREALQGLFGNATRSKRSKIGTFIRLVEAFDDTLYFPAAISEKLGLALVREMGRDPGFAGGLKRRLQEIPRSNGEEETGILSAALAARGTAPAPARGKIEAEHDMPPPRSVRATSERIVTPITEALELRFSPARKRLELVGEDVTMELAEALERWLRDL